MTDDAKAVRNIRLKIAYNGKNYAGWQVQENDVTVQGEIEKALEVIHKEKVKLTGSGRTDSGVHARGQVANFKSRNTSVPDWKFALALNSLLPSDIRILESAETCIDFNSRYDAVERVYTYYITDNPSLMPWERDFSLFVNRKLDMEKLNSIASAVTGTHDFSSFSAPMPLHVSPVRSIYSSAFYSSYPFVIYKISGNGFLRKMVRSITGTILDLYAEEKGREDFIEIMNSRNRSLAGTTAPARGLFLESVIYRQERDGKNR